MSAVAAKATTVFERESLFRVRAEILPLLERHWTEIAHHKDIPLAPDWLIYELAEDQRSLRVFTARKSGKLVGYAVFFVRPGLHYKTAMTAQQDILFIDKKHRGFGRAFISWCDETLRDEGVQLVYHHVKDAHDFSPLLKRLGYELIDHIYGRRLF